MIIQKVIDKIQGSKVSRYSTALYIIHLGIIPCLRGLTYVFRQNITQPFFIGKGVRLKYLHNCKLGKGVFVGDYCHLNFLSLEKIVIGNRVTIREFGWLQATSHLKSPGVTISIGDDTYVGPRALIGGAAPLSIGARCQIGANVSFVAENHAFEGDTEISQQGTIRVGISIGDDCWIGNGACILDGVTLGDGCVVGAGAIVTKSFESGSVLVGNPAKSIRNRLSR